MTQDQDLDLEDREPLATYVDNRVFGAGVRVESANLAAGRGGPGLHHSFVVSGGEPPGSGQSDVQAEP